MLTDDVRFEGWDVRDWQRLLSLFRRPGLRRGEATGPSGGVIAVHDGGRLYKLLHTRVGRLELVGQPWPVSPEQLAATHDAAWAVSLHTGALDEVMERFGARATRGEDIVTQALSIAAIVREMAIEGAIDAWPARLASLRLPSASVIASTLSSLCPEGRVLAVGLFEDGDLFTAIAIRRRASGFDLVLGPDDLRGPMGLLSGDWRRDYRHLARAVEERAGPLAAGLFTETSTLSSLASGGSPGAWARAVAVRDVIVSPMSGPALLPLVVDAVHGTLHTARALGERYDPTGRVAPALRALWGEPADGEAARPGTLATAVRAFFDR